MRRALVLVEGQTEERFIKDVLQPHLWKFDLSLEPKIVTTKRIVGAVHKKGGGDFSKIDRDVRLLLGDSDAIAVTTFFDYYGFPKNFPPKAELPIGLGARGANLLEQALNKHFAHKRFRAYIQLYEFETILFCPPYLVADVLLDSAKRAQVEAERSCSACAEEINDSPDSSPSARIQRIFGSYRKTLHGPTAARRTGLAQIRADCPRFNDWVNWLEGIVCTV